MAGLLQQPIAEGGEATAATDFIARYTANSFASYWRYTCLGSSTGVALVSVAIRGYATGEASLAAEQPIANGAIGAIG